MKLPGESGPSDEDVKGYVSALLGNYDYGDSRSRLEKMSGFFTYLADHLDHNYFVFLGIKDVLRNFEAVTLMLLEELELFPQSIKSQAEKTIGSEDFSSTIGTLLYLEPEDAHRLRFHGSKIYKLARGLLLGRSEAFEGLSQKRIFSAKLAAQKLAQIAAYAASTEPTFEKDFGGADVREHFDPDRIDKFKVLALINLLRGECDHLPLGPTKTAIESRLERLETELKRNRPRWKEIVLVAVTLLGLLADLKTLNPNIYSNAHRFAHEIVTVIHTSGSAHDPRQPHLPILPKQDAMPALMPPRQQEPEPDQDSNDTL